MLRTHLRVLALVALNIPMVFASVQKVGQDLYVYVSENDSSSNSLFLIGDQGILVVDTGLNAVEGQKLLLEIRKISPLPVRWIVNTHYHPDHRGGNSAVGPEAVVISTSYTRGQVLRNLDAEGKKPGERTQEYTLNETLGSSQENKNKSLTLYVGNHQVQIYYPGPAHTRGDLLVYFSDQHVVATGDLFLNGSCPYMDDGDMENWINVLDQLLALPMEHVVPGHFNVGGKAELKHFRDYLEDLRVQVERMYSHGLALDQVKKKLALHRYRDLRQFPQYEATFADNAAVYYTQLQSRAHTVTH